MNEIQISLTEQEANNCINALNLAVKASTNALETASALLPIVFKLNQAAAKAQFTKPEVVTAPDAKPNNK